MKNITLIVILIILLVADIFLGYSLIFPSLKNVSLENKIEIQKEAGQEKGNPLPENEEISSLKIVLVGDIMLDRGVKDKIEKEGNGDYKFPFLKIAPYLQKVDVVFGNLEGPITSDGQRVGSEYSFRDDPKCIEGLKYAHFNVLSLANNHILDYGQQGLVDTISILKESGILYVGAGMNLKDTFSLKIKEIGGVKIGFLAFTEFGSKYWWPKENSPGVAYLPERNFRYAKGEIEEAKKKVDILIVSLHAGEEYSNTPTDFQKKFSKMAIEAGADIVVGHHPHAIQSIERYKTGWIDYSLGNFIFDQFFSEETMKGEILEVKVDKKTKKIKAVEGREFKINKSYQPYFENLTFKN